MKHSMIVTLCDGKLNSRRSRTRRQFWMLGQEQGSGLTVRVPCRFKTAG